MCTCNAISSHTDHYEIQKIRIRMIEVPHVSHAAWTYCRTGESFKMLKREGRGGRVRRIT